jgi:tetrahydromethanopterin S-methyltransferase subunit G
MKKAKKSSAKRERLPDRSSELLVNQRMLYLVRDELKADIRSHDKRFDSIDRRFESIDKRFDSIDKRFDSLDAKLESRFASVESTLHRMMGLMEEQNNRNLAVLDGYQALYDHNERTDRRLDELEKK